MLADACIHLACFTPECTMPLAGKCRECVVGRTQAKLGHILMDLRKCCNHPVFFDEHHFASFGPRPPVDELVADSGKLALIDKMVAKLKQQGHRTLIYSQFTMVSKNGSYMMKGDHSFAVIDKWAAR